MSFESFFESVPIPTNVCFTQLLPWFIPPGVSHRRCVTFAVKVRSKISKTNIFIFNLALGSGLYQSALAVALVVSRVDPAQSCTKFSKSKFSAMYTYINTTLLMRLSRLPNVLPFHLLHVGLHAFRNMLSVHLILIQHTYSLLHCVPIQLMVQRLSFFNFSC